MQQRVSTMHHSFIYRNTRVDVQVFRQGNFCAWTCDFDSPGQQLCGSKAMSFSDGLSQAAHAARASININPKDRSL
jgi:hypothetical protein